MGLLARTLVAMIHEVEGDILLSDAAAIAHGVAPNDPFDQGLALELRERWPAMYKDYRHYWHVNRPKVGELWAWAGADANRIVNLLTQEPAPTFGAHPGPASLTNVHHALRELKKFAKKEELESLALPRLATGVGRLDWPDVKKEIESQLGDLDIPVYVYVKYVRGQKAKEPT